MIRPFGLPRVLGVASALALHAIGGAVAAQSTSGSAAWSDPSPHQVRFVSVAPDVRLEVLDWGGSGPALVFLSGLQDVAHGFDAFAPRFTDRHRVLAITRRGYGASSQPADGYDLTTRLADLHAVLDSLRLVRVDLVGHSIAGDELTAFAGRYPGRVGRLVYLDAAYDHSGLPALLPLSPPPPPMLARDSASPQAVQSYLRRTWGMRIPEAQLRAIGRYSSAGRLVGDVTPARIDSLVLAGCGHPNYGAVRAPALVIDAVIQSTKDVFPTWRGFDAGPRKAAARFAAALQAWAAAERAKVRRELHGAELVELRGANHYVFDSHTDTVIRAMREFLARPGST